MKCEVEVPNTVLFIVSMSPKDEMYNACMWARIEFDKTKMSMMAQSDCGSFACLFPECKESNFLTKMAYISKTKLLERISEKKEHSSYPLKALQFVAMYSKCVQPEMRKYLIQMEELSPEDYR